MTYYLTYRERELSAKKVRRRRMKVIQLPDGKARRTSRHQRADRKPLITSGTFDPMRSALLAAGRR